MSGSRRAVLSDPPLAAPTDAPVPRRPTVASPYLTSHELCDYLKLPSLSALYSVIREHGLPVCHCGGRIRGDIREIDPWLRGQDPREWAVVQRRGAKRSA
jgi:hypothetical protein